MADFEDLFHRIDAGGNLDSARLEIANLLATELEASRESFGPWEALHFGSSVAALSRNIARGDAEAPWGLRLCLVTLYKALTPPEQQSPDYPVRDADVAGITYELLREAIRELGGHAS